MRTNRLLRAVGAVAILGMLVAGQTGLAHAAETPSPNDIPGLGVPISVTPVPPIAKPGARVLIQGEGWPASIPVQIALCGNNALNGTGDCDSAGSVAATTDNSGKFVVYMTVQTPPKPCPCVIFANSFATPKTATRPFTLTGAATATPSTVTVTRGVEASVSLTGTNIAAWFGGSAKRTFRMTVKNTGSTEIIDPPVTLLVGRGKNPSSVLAQPKLGKIAPGAVANYSLPVTFAAPALGEYRVTARFTGLDQPVTETATTSSYPWGLIVIAWLLLQPLLLGLYKRRPGADDDEFADDPFAIAPTPAAGYASDDPLLWDDPVAAGALAAAGAGYAYGTAGDPAGYAVYSGGAIVPRAPRALVPNYRPVFGVTDLRAYLDPGASAAQTTAAPRIVLGGVVPRVNGHAPDAPPVDGGY